MSMQAEDAAAITPSDTAPNCFRAVYVGGTGDVQVKTVRGTTLLFKDVPAGTLLPVQTTLVFETNTTATYLIGILQ